MYYIYEIKGVKIGCTTDMVRRQKEQLSKGKMVVLEECTTIEEASRREIELQREKGYRANDYSYSQSVTNNKTVCHTPEAIKKRVNNRDYTIQSKLQKGTTKYTKQMLTPKARQKAINNTKKKIAAYTKAGTLYKVWDCAEDAGKELNVKRGVLYDTIAGRQKTSRGFVWKYV